MNDKYSTTEGKTSEKLSDEAMLSAQWKNIDWHKAEREVNRLQIRIVKATQQKDYNAVKRLQYLLTHSFYAKALAVKRVVTNDGRRTPGVDGVLWNTPAKKMAAALSLTDKRYRARPLRRVYIEKKDKKKKRPLGIPTMYDRAMQALYALALEPVAETTADGKSFGFRKGRCAQDACEYLFNALSRKHISPKWVLEGDIKGCFDHISHDWLLANIPMDKNILKQFLKAGFIYQRELFPTEEGTPQGGIISPILANMTLDGIEKKLVERFHMNALGKVDSRFKNAHKVNFVRYADDFVVTAATPELALEAKELIREFLAERGLELSDEKTVVTNIDDGFDFLGWNFRKYNEKLIIKPSQKAVKAIVSNISDTILRRGKAWQQDVLIMKLNEQIRGWTNYHQSVCASDAFAHLDYVLYELLWRWAKRRHPKKNKWWISTKYWHRVGNRNWVFSTENKELIRVDSTAIVRHTKIKATANPFLDEAYFQKRKFDKGMHRLTGKFKMIWKNQNGLCYHCGMPMDVTEEREIFYLAPKAKTGVEDVRNMRYVHCACQRIYAENRLKKCEMLEPYDGKLSRTVLRREGGGNTADPADYSPLVNRLKGQVIKISPNSTQFINPMDINANYSEEDNPLSLKADFILSLCELVVGGKEGLLPVEKTVIDRCVHLIYRKYFADPCPENMPILEDLYNALLQQDEKEAHHVATALEIYVKGSLNLFNHRTNVNVNNRIVCYDIKELGKQMKKLGMLIVQDQVWGRVTANRSSGKSTRYYMDEMHLLLKEEQTAAYSVEIWKRFRKWGGIPTGLTQNVKDLLSSREVENIFENSDMIIMLNQAAGDRQILAKQLNISPHQLSYVTHSGEGEGLLFFGNVILPFVDRFPTDLELYRIMTTKLGEVSEGVQK